MYEADDSCLLGLICYSDVLYNISFIQTLFIKMPYSELFKNSFTMN